MAHSKFTHSKGDDMAAAIFGNPGLFGMIVVVVLVVLFLTAIGYIMYRNKQEIDKE